MEHAVIAPVIPSAGSPSSQTALEKWWPLFGDELAQVNDVIIEMTSMRANPIPQLVEHILASGGKRLRPILTILAAKLCGYSGERHVKMAAAIELLHTATLLHDDVVDESEMRRGKATANDIWGNAPSVLVGDFLLGRAFQLMSRDESPEVIRILADSSAVIAEGEVKQLMEIGNLKISRQRYIEIISSKTAELFAAACEIGAVMGERPDTERQALRQFGLNFGIVFQIIDDALDYSARQEKLGKKIGDDFREGKVTLPVIMAYRAACETGDNQAQIFWHRVMERKQGDDDLQHAIELMQNNNIVVQTIDIAQQYIAEASSLFNIFPDSDIKSAMQQILEFSLERRF